MNVSICFSVSCTMPSLEVGTVGGGTVLAPQSACLKVMLFCCFCTYNDTQIRGCPDLGASQL